MPLLPNIQWAQRKDRVYLTIDLQNAKNPTIKLDNGSDGKHGHVSFKGKAQSHATGADAHEYEVELDLFGAIDSEESKISISDRSVLLVIAKQEPTGEHWPRLLKETGKVGRNIKVDWNKWVDEDEEEDKPDDLDMSQLQNLQQFGGGGMPGMGGMGGMPGMGGMGGMPGMADMNFEDLGGDDENINGAADSDDEDLPPLEKE
ncbi:hypothetical protein WJX82_002176 [Trebouxia sp. C0006]